MKPSEEQAYLEHVAAEVFDGTDVAAEWNAQDPDLLAVSEEGPFGFDLHHASRPAFDNPEHMFIYWMVHDGYVGLLHVVRAVPDPEAEEHDCGDPDCMLGTSYRFEHVFSGLASVEQTIERWDDQRQVMIRSSDMKVAKPRVLGSRDKARLLSESLNQFEGPHAVWLRMLTIASARPKSLTKWRAENPDQFSEDEYL